MKLLLIAAASFASLTSAGWINPAKYWNPITKTLPGSTNKKRDLEIRGSNGDSSKDQYYSCSSYNLVSKYRGYPLSGYGYGAVQVGYDPTTKTEPGDPFNFALLAVSGNTTNSAYDCCALAFSQANATMFAYFSNPATFYDDDGNPYLGPNCQIVTSGNNPIAPGEVIIMAASYNTSAPRGTNYGVYLGNGPLGPGITYPYNWTNGTRCTTTSTGEAFQGTFGFSAVTGCLEGTPQVGPLQTTNGNFQLRWPSLRSKLVV